MRTRRIRRRGLVVLLVAAGMFMAGAWGSRIEDANAAGPVIVVHNQSTTVTAEQLADALPAFQAAVTEDLAPVWGTDATVTVDDAAAAAGWPITLTDNPEGKDSGCWCYGYHDFAGVPYAKVFSADGNWQLTLTHELFEMLVDPYINRGARAAGKWWLVEVADPPEHERYAYTRPSATAVPVTISDFVTPAWYGGKRGPYDFTRHIRGPLRLKEGGYACYWGDFSNSWACISAKRART